MGGSTVCVYVYIHPLQAVEDGTLEETESKKYRRRKRKPNDSDDTPAKVCLSPYCIIHISVSP